MDMDSDTSDTSVDDSERGNSGKERDGPSISRRHLSAAAKILEEELLQREPVGKKKSNIKNICSLHLSVPPVSRKLDIPVRMKKTPLRLLAYALTNSICRHDWSTAARVLQTMLQVHRCNNFVYRTVFTVLFNHPQADGETVQDFLNQVFNLRTRPEQLKFLQKLFYLPDDLSACTDYCDKFADEESDEDSSDEL